MFWQFFDNAFRQYLLRSNAKERAGSFLMYMYFASITSEYIDTQQLRNVLFVEWCESYSRSCSAGLLDWDTTVIVCVACRTRHRPSSAFGGLQLPHAIAIKFRRISRSTQTSEHARGGDVIHYSHTAPAEGVWPPTALAITTSLKRGVAG